MQAVGTTYTVADALGIETVLVHPLAGVLSAYGMGLADQSVIREASVEEALTGAAPEIARQVDALGREAAAELDRQGVNGGRVRLQTRVHLRYEGTDSALIVPFGTEAEMRSAFEDVHQRRFGFLMPERELVVEAVTVEAVADGDVVVSQPLSATRAEVSDLATVPMFSGGRWFDPRILTRTQTEAGQVIDGPTVITDEHTTTVVEDGWRALVSDLGDLVLQRARPREARWAVGTTVDPVMLEVFNNLFMNIAEQMGLQLQNTAYSVNIKERLDFSSALFDADGNLDCERAAHARAPRLDE